MGDWLEETLREQFDLVKVLKDNEKTKIVQLRHKILKRDIIERQFTGDDSVYRALLKISHPNLPEIYEVQKIATKSIVLEEFINGVTVADILENGLYTEKGVKTIVSSLCDALGILHEKRIIHRDVKPENVMITNDGVVKLIDFDAAKFYKPYRSEDTRVIGTVGYAAPEQFGISQSDGRTDIFALGVLMNVMLTGEHPSKKLYQGKLTKIIIKCTQIEPGKRYQTIFDLRKSLYD